jgi:hypothetical protein
MREVARHGRISPSVVKHDYQLTSRGFQGNCPKHKRANTSRSASGAASPRTAPVRPCLITLPYPSRSADKDGAPSRVRASGLEVLSD